MHENPAVIMERVIKEHDVPQDKHILLYTYIRLAHSFPNYEKRKLFVQTRLQSLSILGNRLNSKTFSFIVEQQPF
jgi:hypothetical protein